MSDQATISPEAPVTETPPGISQFPASPNRPPAWINTIMSALSILGMMDSGYLTIQHFRHAKLVACGKETCEKVLNHWLAAPFFSIPTSLYGFTFYAAIFLMLGWNAPPRRLFVLSAVAFCIHMFFVYAQAFIIKAFCNYCLASAVTTTLIFLLSIALVRYEKK